MKLLSMHHRDDMTDKYEHTLAGNEIGLVPKVEGDEDYERYFTNDFH
jgi:hypothetical protein